LYTQEYIGKQGNEMQVTIPAKRLLYIPQLDSFRFFAVLLVIFSHWLSGTSINVVPNGFLGVTFFFVLSGFLISSNLLLTKKDLDKNEVGFWHAAKTFYIRRTLRIFPLYFLVILLVFLFVPAVFEGRFAWYVTYVPNFLIAKTHEWPGMLSHFWSLGVEEQFYIAWPFLIFLSPYKWLKYLFPGIILLSIVVKIFLFNSHGPFFNFYDALPISCFDAFGAGALLALLITDRREAIFRLASRIPLWAGFLAAVALGAIIFASGLSFLFGLAVSAGSFFLILKSITGYKGIFALVVNNPVCQYFGKISYGLYVYHNFIPWLVRCLTGRETKYPLPLPTISAGWLHGALPLFAVHFVVLVVVASISWFLIEKPLNNLKKYFV